MIEGKDLVNVMVPDYILLDGLVSQCPFGSQLSSTEGLVATRGEAAFYYETVYSKSPSDP